MYWIALSSFGLGVAVGWNMARLHMLRTLALIVCVLSGATIWVMAAPPLPLTEVGLGWIMAAFLVAPPLAAGFVGGGLLCWIWRRGRAATT